MIKKTYTVVDYDGVERTRDSYFDISEAECIDSTKVDAAELAALEAVLYGSDDTDARLPLPTELVTLFPSAVAAG